MDKMNEMDKKKFKPLTENLEIDKSYKKKRSYKIQLGTMNDLWTVQLSKGDKIIKKCTLGDTTLYEFAENISHIAIFIQNVIATPEVTYNKILNHVAKLIRYVRREREIDNLITERNGYTDTIQARQHTELIRIAYKQKVIEKIEDYMKDLDEDEILVFEKRIDDFLK